MEISDHLSRFGSHQIPDCELQNFVGSIVLEDILVYLSPLYDVLQNPIISAVYRRGAHMPMKIWVDTLVFNELLGSREVSVSCGMVCVGVRLEHHTKSRG
jgi:hypothetical protein